MRKKKKRGFDGRRKNSSPTNNSKAPNYASASVRTSATTTATTASVTDYDQIPSASTINITKTNDEVELPDAADKHKSIMEKEKGCKVTFSPVKTRKRKPESSFLLPDNTTQISRYKIIDSFMLQEIISAARCSFVLLVPCVNISPYSHRFKSLI